MKGLCGLLFFYSLGLMFSYVILMWLAELGIPVVNIPIFGVS